jgi:hypothetical protein
MRSEDLVADERTRLETRLADLRICLRQTRSTDVRRTIVEAIALLESYLSAAYEPEPAADQARADFKLT